MIKAIIFDWGGVLTEGKWIKTVLLLGSLFSCSILIQSLSRPITFLSKITSYLFFDRLVKNLNLINERILNLYASASDPNPNMMKMLSDLKSTYKLVLLSNNDKITTAVIRTKHKKLLSLFDKTYFSFEYRVRKPNAQFFKLPLEDLLLKPKECVFIDNKHKNINAAKALGFATILFENTEQLKTHLVKLGIKL